MKKVFAIVSSAIIVLICSSYLMRPQATYIHMLDIGQGDSFLIETADGHFILVDGGPDGKVTAELGRVLPWWVDKLDMIILTHADADHYGGLAAVLKKYQITYVVTSGDTNDTNDYNYLEALFSEVEGSRVIAAGQTFQLGETTLQFIWPPADSDLVRNSRSLVFYLTTAYGEALFTGDISVREEAHLLENRALHDIDILKVAHHGSADSSDAKFLDILRPNYCLISAGLDNRFGHPRSDVIDRLLAVDCSPLITSQQGATTLVLTENGIDVVSAHALSKYRFFSSMEVFISKFELWPKAKKYY